MVILQFLVVAAAFAIIDAIWLKTMNPFYRRQIGDLMADKPNLGYAVVFYVLTNAATLKTWPWQLIVVDILWGAVLTALATLAGWLVFHSN